MAEIEIFDRRWYAGTLGVMSQNLSEFCVTIRSAFIEENQVRVFAGAGIVEGSQPVEEFTINTFNARSCAFTKCLSSNVS